MRFFLLVCVLIFFVNCLQGQFSHVSCSMMANHNVDKHILSFRSEIFSNSNHFTNNWIQDYLFKAHYKTSDLNTQFQKLSSTNYFNLLWKNNLDYFIPQIHLGPFLGLSISWSNTSIRRLEVGKSLYGLYYLGNTPFLGDTLNELDSKLASLNYHTFSFGTGLSLSPKIKILTQVGIVAGQNRNQRLLSGAKFFTEELGRNIFVDYNYSFEKQDANNSGIFKTNGFGLNLDFAISVSLTQTLLASIELSNLGFVHWYTEGEKIVSDTSYSYSGINVSGFLDSIYIGISSKEDLENKFLTRQRIAKRNTLLPSFFRFTINKSFVDNRIGLFVDFNAIGGRFKSNYSEIKCIYSFNKFIKLGPVMGYSSQSGINGGFIIGLSKVQKFSLNLNLNSGFNSFFKNSNFVGMAGIQASVYL